jgi:transcriptional regulator with XRE-family HTH domain
MSQVELSRATGVAQATISNIESCNRTPSYLTRQRLANALNVVVEEIFPNEQSLGSKRNRKTRKAHGLNDAVDVILVNSTHALSVKPVKENERDILPLVNDSKVIGFVTGGAGERLKYFSLKMFKGDEFVSSSCTDCTGKFVFTNLKPGKYQLATNEGNLMELRLR